MRICILGSGLTALTLAKALVNYEIDVDVFFNKKNLKITDLRTIGISKNNIDFFNSNIINIEKLIWKLKKLLTQLIEKVSQIQNFHENP